MSADVLTPTRIDNEPEDFSMFLNDDAPLFDGDEASPGASLFSADAIEKEPAEKTKKKPAARPTLNNKKPAKKAPTPKAGKENDGPAKTEKKASPATKATPKKTSPPAKKAAAPKKTPAPKKAPVKKAPAAKKKAAAKESEEENDVLEADPAEEEVVAPETAPDASDEEAPATKPAAKARKPAAKKAPLKKPTVSKTIKKPAPKKVVTKKKTVSPKPPKKKAPTKKKSASPSSLGKRKLEDAEGLDDLEDVLVTEPRKKTKKVRSTQPALGMTALSADQKQLLMDVIQPRALGVYALEMDQITDNVTHLVIGEQKRTVKLLLALARGIWIVKPTWTMESVLACKYVDEAEHEANDWFPGCEKARMAKKEGKSLFDGEKIYIHKQTDIPREDLEHIVLLAGAQVVKAKACTVCVTDSEIVGGLPEGVSCVTSDWVLDSLQQGELLPQEDFLAEEVVDEEDDDADSVVIPKRTKSKSPTPKKKKAVSKSKSPAPKKKKTASKPKEVEESDMAPEDESVAEESVAEDPEPEAADSDATVEPTSVVGEDDASETPADDESLPEEESALEEPEDDASC